jgi:hypothetical protein
MAAAIVVLLAMVGFIVRFLDSPSQGHSVVANGIPNLKGVNATPKQAPPPPAQTLSNKYFSLALPAGYSDQTGDPTPTGILYDQTLLKGGDFGSLIITIAIQNLPDGGLSGDSSYQMRQSKPSQYQITNQAVGGDTVHIANDAGSGSVVTFWPHGAYLATISVSSDTDDSGGGGDSDEVAAIQPLLNNWRWQL